VALTETSGTAPVNHGQQRKRKIAGIILVVAVVLLVSSLFVGWWAIQAAIPGQSEKASFNFPATSGGYGVIYSCAGNDSSFTATCPSPETYSDEGLNNTGRLYTSVQYVVIAGIAMGILGALLLFAAFRRQSGSKLGTVLIGLAFILAIVAPIALAVAQPGAIQSDNQPSFGGTNGTTPSNSFWGSNNSSDPDFPYTVTWGASTGWYLALVAGGFFLVALVILVQARHPTNFKPKSPVADIQDESSSAVLPERKPDPPSYWK
jgi:hypothetical protein